jgi:uncharacterized protein YqeY
MTLKERISDDLKTAMRSGDELAKTALRQLLAGIRQAELDVRVARTKGRGEANPSSDAELAALEQISLTDAEVIGVVQKEAKSIRESLADAERAGRPDLVERNAASLRLVEAYLPRQLTRDEIAGLARAAIAEAGATDLKQLGAVMKLLSPRVKGVADGRVVNEVVRELLAG